MVVAVAITLNGLLMAAESQWAGFKLAEDTGHRSARGDSAEASPHAVDVFKGFGMAFGVFFSVELLLKIAALRAEFVRDPWNWMDSIIVALWLLGKP